MKHPSPAGIRPSRGRPNLFLIVVVLCVGACLLAPLGTAREAASASGAIHEGPSAGSTSPGVSSHVAPSISGHFPHPTWVNVTSSGGVGSPPPTLEGASSAFDPVDNETVLFGGCLTYICSLFTNQTWVFANGAWTNETNVFDAPPARDFGSMDYDANMQAVLLFGGQGPTSELNDTWLFSGGTWTNVTDWGPGPIARYGASMAFDPQPEENGSVLFGGYSDVLGYLNDTWVWQGGAGWVPLTSPSIAPPQVVYASMAYDAADGYLVLFGGYVVYVGYAAETWELYAGQWWEVSPPASPLARAYASMIYVPSLSSVLLFGGFDIDDEDANDTWLFSAGSWTQQTPAAAPPSRDSFGLALDGTGTTPIVVGGCNSTVGVNRNDTWAYEFPPTTGISSPQTAAEVGENVTFSATIAQGTGPFQVAFDLGDGASAFASGPGPVVSVVHSFDRTGTFDVSANVTDAVGAFASSVVLAFPVSAAPAITATAAPTAGDAGVPIAFTSTLVSAGTPPVAYLWEFGDGLSATTANTSHTFSAAGTYLVTLNATDADHANATAQLSVTVAPDPTLAVAASPASSAAGTDVSLFANATGGTGPYSFSWRFGDGTTSTFPAPQHAFTTPGRYSVEVWVNDSVGSSTSGNVTISVASATTTASNSSSPWAAPWWFWAGIGSIVVAATAGTILLLRRR